LSGLEALLDSRASFVLAALAVSWIAVVLLALVAANLHFRLAHLERSQRVQEPSTPYGHLLGRSLADLLGPQLPAATRLAFVLSSDCPSCDRVLAELREAGAPGVPVALLWRDATPSPLPPLPAGVAVLDDGPQLSRTLGIGVSPFALAADAAGRIDRATPVGSVKTLAAMLANADRDEPPGRSSTPQLHQPLKGVSR
jgi:hypothetical protein